MTRPAARRVYEYFHGIPEGEGKALPEMGEKHAEMEEIAGQNRDKLV